MTADPFEQSFQSSREMADIFFVPAPARVVTEMLRIAEVTQDDLVMDLGSGDGQILLAAARDHGARGLGIEINPLLVTQARAAAEAGGFTDRLEYREQDFFEADLRPASVLMLYLLDSINVRLRPKILRECRPGTRVVTYSFEMGEWQCDAHIPIAANGVSLWIVPANLSGEWEVQGDGPRERSTMFVFEQRYQELNGTAVVAGTQRPILAGRVRGNEFSFAVGGSEEPITFSGRVDGEQLWWNDTGEFPDGSTALRRVGSMRPLE